MNKTFTITDLLVLVLLVAILISLWLAMKLVDRQHEALMDISQTQQRQSEVLRSIEAKLKSGVAIANGDQNTTPQINAADAFPRIAEARKAAGFAYGDWYIDAFASVVGKLTPLVQTDAYQSAIANYVLESLISRDPETLEWQPVIAKSWTVAEDGLTIEFKLRTDVTFSDGSPLTAHDVEFTYRMIMNPDINCPALRTYYENITNVVAADDYTVSFQLNKPYFQSLEFTGGMAILPKKFYSQFTPEEFNQSPGLLVGSGPYRLEADPKKWEPGEAVVLVRNENYWGPRPTYDKLVFKTIPDPAAQLVALRNRKIDRYGVPPYEYARLKEDKSLNAKAELLEYYYPNAGYRYIGWNQQRDGKPTFFADRRVRQAMTMLTNRQEMAEQLMAGLAKVATGPFNPLGQQVDPDIKPMPYDAAKARELLADAGFTDRDGDGLIESKDGKPFSFKLTYPASNKNYEQMAFYLKDAYARAGIEMVPEPTEWNTMLQRIDERDFDAITLGWTGNIEGDPKQIFHSESMKAGGSNYVSYANPQLDKLIDEARVNLDRDSRLKTWHEVHRLLHEDQPYTFLFFSKAPIFIDKRIRNVQITRSGMNDRTEMYVPKDLQLWTK